MNKEGRKRGQKRRDFHYTDENGDWDSRFEAQVFKGAVDAGTNVRRNYTPIPYARRVPRASCQDCGSDRVGETRRITFDLRVDNGHSEGKEDFYYLEPKGYMRAPKRSLYRSFFKDKPGISVRFIIQSNYRVGKGSFGEWINKHLNSPWFLWKGVYPTEEQWIFPIVKNKVKSSTGSRNAASAKRKKI